MGKVRSFNLSRGTRIGNYRVIENIGRGWEGEVYKVSEVPTESIRALKLFRADELDSVRHLVHFAWYYEQVRRSGSVPIYYHYGQWFLDDDNGCWYLVFEFIAGKPLVAVKPSEQLFFRLARSMARVHELGYAVGDLSTLTNVIIRATDGEPIFVDCEPGKPDLPNTAFRSDCLEELPGVAKVLFGKSTPPKVATILRQLKDAGRIESITLGKLLDAEA